MLTEKKAIDGVNLLVLKDVEVLKLVQVVEVITSQVGCSKSSIASLLFALGSLGLAVVAIVTVVALIALLVAQGITVVGHGGDQGRRVAVDVRHVVVVW